MKKTGLFLAAVVAALLPSVAFAQSYYYPYSPAHYDDDVVCFPDTQTIEEGERAYFIAYGGDGDYDWKADGHTYNNRDSDFSYRFEDEGTETVTVKSDGESDTCRVRVVDERDYDYYPPHYPTYPTYPTYTPPVNVVTTYVPKGLPNTGFPPVSSASLAFAAVLLLGAGVVLTPYAKKIVASIR